MLDLFIRPRCLRGSGARRKQSICRWVWLLALSMVTLVKPVVAITTNDPIVGAGQVAQAGAKRLEQLAFKATGSMHPCWTRLYEQFAYSTDAEHGCRGGVERPAMLMLTCHLSSSGRLSNASEALRGLYQDFIKIPSSLNTTTTDVGTRNEPSGVDSAPTSTNEHFDFDVFGIASALSPHEFQLYSLFFAHCASICYFLLAYRHTAQVKEAVQQMQADASAAMQAMQRVLERQPQRNPLRELLGWPLLLALVLGWLLQLRFGRFVLIGTIGVYAAGGWVAIAGMPVPWALVRVLYWLRDRFDRPVMLLHDPVM
ncbi:hypothetical protein CCYA_CCYA09G2518 [Cyanidiococcus yangmingshanensis]|nr:hypothetical protein CCYA_CCYA09G2518 [Cyanidiococcus yangmingshanensis]